MTEYFAERISTLRYATHPRRNIVHTLNPALPVGGSVLPPSMSPRRATAVSKAASPFNYGDACLIWQHLADPAPARTEITAIDDDALVASPDPEMVFHVDSADYWHDGEDPRIYREVPVREVLDQLLDTLDHHSGLLDDPPASAHDLWNRFVSSDEYQYSRRPLTFTDSRTTESIGPYTGWRLIPGERVCVKPLGRNNFRTPEQVRVIQAVVDLAGSTVDGWCDAHDALRSDDLRSSRTSVVAAEILARGLGADDRRLVREVFLDLMLWQAGQTSGPQPLKNQYQTLGAFIPESEVACGSVYRSIGVDAAGYKMSIHFGESGFEFSSYTPDSLSFLSEPELRVTVPREGIRQLCEGFGVPSYAHPLPVVSLFADEIHVLGPQEWLRRNGVVDWVEDYTPVPSSSAADLTRDFVATMHRPPAGGHGSGVGLPGKSEFPPNWSRETVMERLRKVTLEPRTRTVIGSTVFYEGEFDDVWLCVIRRQRKGKHSRTITAYPFAGDDVVFNEFPDDYPRNLVIPAARAICEDVDSTPSKYTRLIRNALACGEPYEVILAALHVAEKFQIALPLERMNTVAQLIFSGFFNPVDKSELVEVFSALAERDYPEKSWVLVDSTSCI
ncbi:hypothetical protein [Rhodococcus sp. NPDC049939]|uniref:hypothetical protein n=1 Tax=Rhodococcus sp. NPDC049939 TaxID=3155511 RepID=UPI0033D7B990